METIVVPLRSGNEALARRYESHLTRSHGLNLVRLNLALLKAAAHLRAMSHIKTPDAIQLAEVLTEGCSTFLANDHSYPRFPGQPARSSEGAAATRTPRCH